MRLAALIAAVACAWLAAIGQSHAQESDLRGTPTVLLDLGFSGTLPADQWAPIRIVVSPLEEAVQGMARIRISAANDTLTTLVPVTTTPGRETVVPTTIWISPTIASIQVELLAESGARIATTSYGALAGAQAVGLEPPTAMPIILGVGSPSLRLAFGRDNYERDFDGPRGEIDRSRAAVARVASAVPPAVGLPPWLPTEAMAYQGVTALVIDGAIADRLAPDALEAIREWVISGGRLMIVNANNTAIRLILAQHAPQGLALGQLRGVAMPRALGGPISMAVRTLKPTDLPPAWSTDWQGMVANGPVGLGSVSIVGFDPDAHANNDRIAAAETAWHTIMGPLVSDQLEHGRQLLGTSQWNDTSLETIATQAALGWVARAPVVGTGAFLAIFAMMLGLAIALGPIDRFALRRLRSLHRWWLTAIAWIALATIGAWLAPSYVRSGPTSVGSIRTVDAWQDSTGTVHAWQTTISGIFLNRSAAIEFDDLEQTAWLSPAVHPWQYTGMGSLTSVSTNGAPATQATTARLWTTRSFEQQGPTTLPIAVDFSEGRDQFELRLRGPMAERVETIAVRTGGRWLHLLPGGSPRREGSDLILRAIRRDLVSQPPRSFDIDHLVGSRDGLRPYMYGYTDRRPPSSLTLELPGPAERSQSFEALSDTDEWAVVYLAWDGDDPLIAANVGESFETLWVTRIAVPVERTQ